MKKMNIFSKIGFLFYKIFYKKEKHSRFCELKNSKKDL